MPGGQVLRASKIDIRFKCTVALRRLPLFRVLHIEGGHASASAFVLFYLPLLAGVEKLVVSQHALEGFWEFTPGTLDWHPEQAVEAQQATTAFRCIRSLREIEGFSVPSEHAHLESLLPLEAHVYRGNRAAFDLAEVQQSLTTVPPLSHLVIRTELPHASHLTFANSFSMSLLHLHLSYGPGFDGLVMNVQQPLFTSEHRFPLLTELSFSGNAYLSLDTIASSSHRCFPKLDTMNLDLRSLDDFAKPNILRSVKDFLQSVRINIKRADTYDQDLVYELARSSDEMAWDLVFLPRDDFMDPPPSPRPPDSPTLDGQAELLRTTLRYALQQVDEAEDKGDWARFDSLRSTLEEIEFERLANEAWERA
ncbi:hypothetical protein JCM8097_000811 [Rhodosporidiobolus ruineniae]